MLQFGQSESAYLQVQREIISRLDKLAPHNLISNHGADCQLSTLKSEPPINIGSLKEIDVVETPRSLTSRSPSQWSPYHNPQSVEHSVQETLGHIVGHSANTFDLHKASRCDDLCHCNCHFRRHLTHPTWMDESFGALFVGHTGLPVLRVTCSTETCRNRFSRTLSLQYTFPSWFITKKIQFVAATTFLW